MEAASLRRLAVIMIDMTFTVVPGKRCSGGLLVVCTYDVIA